MSLARQTEHALVLPAQSAEALRSNPIHGRFTLTNALQLLLKDSELSGGLTKNGVITISSVKQSGGDDNVVKAKSKGTLLAGVSAFLFGAGSAVLPATAQIDEIIVTAEKRAESIQDIPISITAYSGQELAKSGVLSIKDLPKISPTFQFGQDGAVNYIGMRGVSAGLGVIGAEGSVTVSQNGVTFGRISLWDADLYDIDRVEVLRGPQGVINGRNATGGAVNIHTRMPTEEFEAGIRATIGNYRRFATDGYLSGPLFGSNLRGRLAFSTDHSNGWIENTFLNEDLATKGKAQARATFVADLSDDIEAVLILDAIRDRSIPATSFDRGRIRPDQPGLSEFLGVSGGDVDSLTLEGDQARTFEKDQYGATLRVTFTPTDTITLTSITGYVDQDINQTYDCDGTRASFCGFPSTPMFPEGYGFEVQQFSQELTLAADITDDFDLIFGGIYLHDDSTHFNHFTASDAFLTPDSTFVTAKANLESYAVYTQLRYELSELVRLAAGVRYTKDEKTYEESGLAIFTPGAYGASNSWDAFTPRFAIDVQPNDDLTIFASVSRGFRSGGYSITFLGPEDEFDPEYVWNYEAGLKASLFDGRANVALSGFVMDYKNIQQIVFGLAGTGTDTINAAGADIKGVEVEFNGAITDNFLIDFSGAWLDAEFSEFRTADPIFTDLGVFNPVTGLNVRDLSGNRLPRAPKWKFNIAGEYRHQIKPDIMGVLRADYTWQDEMFFGPYNYDLAAQESYGLLGLSAGLEGIEGNWSFTAFARNVTDTRYFQHNSVFATFINPTPSQFGFPGEPRRYGVTLSYDF